jgi:thiamine pyrophosphokinase
MTDPTKKIVLFANGDLPAPAGILSRLSSEDHLIAVDGGLSHVTQHGMTPNLIIGDLDSADPTEVEKFRAQGVTVQKFPPEKDETDLELALDAALAMKPERIWILGALGKRFDQSLANIFLLARDDFADIDLRLIDGQREIFLIRDFGQIEGVPGERVSLIPLHGPAHGVRTQGLLYPLKDETLYPDRTRGISNELIAPSAQITLQSGLLICIHAFSDTNQKGGSND